MYSSRPELIVCWIFGSTLPSLFPCFRALAHCIPLLLPAALATAQTGGPAFTEQVIVSGSRLETASKELSGSHFIMSGAQVTKAAKQSVVDLIRTIPGVQIGQQGGAGGVSVLYLRGGEPNFTAVMIDGVVVNDPTNSRGGSFDFSSLEPSAIERIELVNGPGSALYGSGPLSGTINIITQGGDAVGHSVSATTGTDGFWNGQLTTAGTLANTAYRLSVGASDFGEQTPGSTFDSTFASGKLTAMALGADISWAFRYADASRTSFPEDSGGPELAIIRDLDTETLQDFSTALSAHWPWSEQLSGYAKLAWYSRQGDFVSPGIEAPLDGVPRRGDDTDYERTDIEAALVWAYGDHIELVAGLNAQLEDGRNDGFLVIAALETDFSLERDSYGTVFEAKWSPTTHLVLSGGVRVDDTETAGTQTNHALGAVWSPGTAGTSLYTNFATGFKLPSFFALGHALVGNPELIPEESDTWQIGVRQQLLKNRLNLAIEWYSSEFKNLIDFDEQLFLNVNRSLVESQGVDVSASYSPANARFSVRGFVSYLDLDVVSSNDVLRGRPRWHAGLSGFYAFTDRLGLHMDYIWNDTTLEAALPLQTLENPSGLRALAAYNRVDLALTWSASSALDVQLAIDNVLDERYQEAVGFRAPGIKPRLRVKYSF